MAAMVPMGMDFWASRRSPERLEPAMIPEEIIATVTQVKSRRADEEMRGVAVHEATRGRRRGGAEERRRGGDAHPSQRGSRCRPAA